jgi:pimeloyl-ACP methyl ester carboxylesterase
MAQRTDISIERTFQRMNMITTKDGTTIYYKEWGQGQPVVFSHGWPLSADARNSQIVYPGAAHGLTDTLKDELNADLLAFLKA